MANVLLFFRIVVSIFYVSISFSQENNVTSTDNTSIILQFLKTLDLGGKPLTLEQYKFLSTLIQKKISALQLENSNPVTTTKLENSNPVTTTERENIFFKSLGEHMAKVYYCGGNMKAVIERLFHFKIPLWYEETTRMESNVSKCVSAAIESRKKLLKKIFKNLVYDVAKEFKNNLKPTFNEAYDKLKFLNLTPQTEPAKCKQLYDALLDLKNSQNEEDAWNAYKKNENLIWQNIDYEQDRKNQTITLFKECISTLQQLGSENQQKSTRIESVIKLLIQVKELNFSIFNTFKKQRARLITLRIDKSSNLDYFDTRYNELVDKDLAQALVNLSNPDISNSTAYTVFLDTEAWISRAEMYEPKYKGLEDLGYTKDATTLNEMTHSYPEGAKLYIVQQCSNNDSASGKTFVRAYVHFLKQYSYSHEWTGRMEDCVYTLTTTGTNGAVKQIINDLKNESLTHDARWKKFPLEEMVVTTCSAVIKIYNDLSPYFDIKNTKPLPKNCEVQESDYMEFIKCRYPLIWWCWDMTDVAVVLSRMCPKSYGNKNAPET